MVCLYCGSLLEVTNSRSQRRLNRVWRRRRCKECGALFTSHEAIDLTQSLSVRMPDGSLAPFIRDKLFVSLYRSCQHRVDALSEAGGLADTVISTVSLQSVAGAIEIHLITGTAFTVLQRFDKAAAVQYQAFHPIKV